MYSTEQTEVANGSGTGSTGFSTPHKEMSSPKKPKDRPDQVRPNVAVRASEVESL